MSRHEGRSAVNHRSRARAQAGVRASSGERAGADHHGRCRPLQTRRGSSSGRGGEALVLPCDVASSESVAELGAAVARFGGADILIHNAGIYPMYCGVRDGRIRTYKMFEDTTALAAAYGGLAEFFRDGIVANAERVEES